MGVYGTFNGRRVQVDVVGRGRFIRVVDDASGREIQRIDVVATTPRVHLDGRTMIIGSCTIILDIGEEAEGAELVRVTASVAPSGESAPPFGLTHDDRQRGISTDEVELEILRQDVVIVARRAAKASSIVTNLLVLAGVVTVVLGLIVMFTDKSGLAGTSVTNVDLGIVIVIVGLTEMVFGLMFSLGLGAVAQYIRYRAEGDRLRQLTER